MKDKRLEGSLGYALVRAFRRVNRASNRALAAFGLSAEQAHILLILWDEGPLKVGELQERLALGSGTITGALDRMDKLRLVRRVADPSDGRAFRVEAMPFETKKQNAVVRSLEKMENEAFGAMSEKERKELLRLLSKIEAV